MDDFEKRLNVLAAEVTDRLLATGLYVMVDGCLYEVDEEFNYSGEQPND